MGNTYVTTKRAGPFRVGDGVFLLVPAGAIWPFLARRDINKCNPMSDIIDSGVSHR